ncbi:MAG: hypothetical protein WBA10_13070 [Elainellaceae cyanobacterium]
MIPTSQPTPPLNPKAQTYRDQLHPWCIVRLLPKAQRITVARFRKRNDADAHTRTLRRLIPNATFIVIFASPPPTTEIAAESDSDAAHRDIDPVSKK